MKLPESTRNWLTIIGAIIAGINLALVIILFIFSTIFEKNSTYLGLFIYVILPAFMLLGLILVPVGMYFRKRKLRKSASTEALLLPRIDLNNPRQRKIFVAFSIGTVVFLFITTLGSFEAFHLTESVEFCGTLCHKVMEPEYTAYRNSPHANVACVDCHVGSGASWYVKSKLSGLHQVYAVIAKTYPTPIPTPLHDLRPARETCERCHWPEKFYSRTLQTKKYFLADSLNSEWDIMLQMKTGPEYVSPGFKEGIHWHINPDISVEYISDNDKREVITYVKLIKKSSGEVTIFRDPNNPVSDSLIAAQTPRTMDCIDCHNRPSHKYSSPTVFFDKAMLSGQISREIPFMKKLTMGVLRQTFPDRDTAEVMIHDSISNFYRSGYPGIFSGKKELLDKSIQSIKQLFSQNTFPSMKVTYDAYPEHIGHLESTGCFRCHNNSFKSEEGITITRDCNLCHTVIGQGKPSEIQLTNVRDTLEFRHPVDIGTAWKEANCSECHMYLY
jgi:nitrate/TMAO reductase-like tetraheme cytochrome c subunit